MGLADVLAEGWPSMPVLLISGRGEPGLDYPGPLPAKPYTVEALLDAVAGLVPLPSGYP